MKNVAFRILVSLVMVVGLVILNSNFQLPVASEEEVVYLPIIDYVTTFWIVIQSAEIRRIRLLLKDIKGKMTALFAILISQTLF